MKRVTISILILTACGAFGNQAYAQWPLGPDITKQARSAEQGTTVTATGRFQIFVSPNMKGHTFMLDTDTGRVWVVNKDSLSGNFSLQRVHVEQVDEEKKSKQEKATSGETEKKASE